MTLQVRLFNGLSYNADHFLIKYLQSYEIIVFPN